MLPYIYEWRTALSVALLAVATAVAAGWRPARGAVRQEVSAAQERTLS